MAAFSPMKIGRNMDMSVGKWDRKPLRFQEMQARYFLKDGTEGELCIMNITDRGMGCRCGTAAIMEGEEIGIELPYMGVRTGIVRWTKDGNCGIQMAQAMDVDCLKLYSNGIGAGSSAARPAPQQAPAATRSTPSPDLPPQ